MRDKVTKLDYSQRWVRDGLRACGHAGAIEAVDADVTAASEVIRHFRAQGTQITWTHIFVRAAAMVLDRNPEIHRLVAGNACICPSTVDICLSLAGDSSVTPVLIIEDAASKDLLAIAAEIRRQAPVAQEETRKMLAGLRRFGWLVPFSGLRRALIGFLLRRTWYRRKASGTFQVTCLPRVDFFAPLLFNTVAALGVGRVHDKVVAVNGHALVRPSVTLTCSMDHAQWNGVAGAQFLTALVAILESGEFAESLSQPLAARKTARATR